MTRFTLITAVSLLAVAPALAQTANETADEIVNESAETALDEMDTDPIMGEEDCMNPAAEVVNQSADSEIDETECVTPATAEPVAGEEIFEQLDEEDDGDT